MKLNELLSKHSVVGVVGNRSTGKSMSILKMLKDLKAEYNIPVYVLGVEPTLHNVLLDNGICVLESTMDVLDLQIRNAVIWIDEFACMFSTQTKNKQLDKLEQFFDRVEHNNVKLILGTAREGFWNKFACARITAFVVKEIEYSSLVNGTWLKERVEAINSLSPYRLECPKDTYYIVSNSLGFTHKHTIGYDATLDSKKENINLFAHKKGEQKSE